MNHKKKLLALALALVVSTGVFSACGSDETSSVASNPQVPQQEGSEVSTVAESKPEEHVKLVYSYWGNQTEQPAKAAIVQDFIKEHPNYEIEETYTDGGTYPTKLQTWFASNTAPDVLATANDVIYDFVGQGVFEDLTPYMERDGLLHDVWVDSMVKAFTYDGRIISAPHLSKPAAVVYNKDLFDKAGVAYPKQGWSEEDFLDTARQLTSGDGLTKVYGLNLTWMASELLRALYTGSAYYDVDKRELHATDNEGFKHALEMFTGLVKDGVSPNSTEAQSIGGGFETGRFAMSFLLPSNIKGFDEVVGDTFDWEVVNLPVSDTYGQWQATLRADGLAISSASKNKDAAWEFVKWHTTDPEAQAAAGDVGIPSLLSYTVSGDYLNAFPEGGHRYDKSVFIKATENAVGIQSAGVWGEINGILSENYDKILYDNLSVDDALQNIQTGGEKLLK